MARSLSHPRRNAALSNFFPDVCAIKENKSGFPTLPGMGALASRYAADDSPLTGSDGMAGAFETQAPSKDRVLIPQPLPQILTGMLCVLPIQGKECWFSIADALPAMDNAATLLILTPKE